MKEPLRIRNLFEKWFANSRVPSLAFWSDKRVRTQVLVFQDDVEDVRVPYGTFAFEIRSFTDATTIVTFQDGQILVFNPIPGVLPTAEETIQFPGQPYIERDDIFTKIQFVGGTPATRRLEIICHRLIKKQS